MASRDNIFTTIRTEGALLPPDLLQRISENTNLDGLTPESYHLYPGEKLNEAVNQRWNRLQGVWTSFRAGQERLPEDDLGTTLTRERWLLPLFDTLGYGRLQTATAVEIDGRSYPISHGWEHVPIHLVSYKVEFDKRTPGAAGAATASPHSLLQVFLNRSDDNLWGFLSNGYRLRILRDNASLTRQAYVEFDLEAMMDGEVYSDFVLLWLLCHQSRVEGEKPSDCWLEKWMKVAEEQGTRARDQLRDGVQSAIEALGLGFLEHPANATLRDQLTSGELSSYDYYHQLLRMVYRLLFLFVAEDRDLLLNPAADAAIQKRYVEYYSTQRLRRMAETFKGTRHPDLFEALRLVMRLLSGNSNGAGAGLGLVSLGSFLFSDGAVKDVIDCQIANSHLLDAIRALSLTYDQKAQVYRTVDYKNLGSDELGSIFESLLELHPQINVPARRFSLSTAAGNERKTTGSYYTPDSLVNALLDSALDPVLNEATKQGADAILDLKVCDPACGSGHFLIAAANRMAKALAFVRTSEEEPPPAAIQEAKRDVISHCIYGVDINPMAVELCKVNLWMEALEPGKPLNFLDHRIQVGNSLLGTTPRLMAGGIPDDAFNPIEGDDPKYATTMKKVNREERKARETGQRSIFELVEPPADYGYLTEAMHALDDTPDDTLDEVRRKEAQYAALASDPEYVKARLLADAWCAAFVWEKAPSIHNGQPLPMTDLLYRRMEDNPLAENLQSTRETVVRLTKRYDFFHWHVAFPDVFSVPDDLTRAANEQTGWDGGFDCVLGNPPWDKIQLEEQKFFAGIDADIANASAAKRKRLINELSRIDPDTFETYTQTLRSYGGQNNLIRMSGYFPLTGKGNLTTHSLFAELSTFLIHDDAKTGIIVPSGLATQDSQKEIFEELVRTGKLVKFYDFENREGLFPTVHRMYRFATVVIGGYRQDGAVEFAFFLQNPSEIKFENKIFYLKYADLKRISPNTLSAPMLLNNDEARIFNSIYRYSEILYQEYDDHSSWGWHSWQMFNETHERDLLQEWDENWRSIGLDRLYTARLTHQYDHRFSTYQNDELVEQCTPEQKQNPFFEVQTRYCVSAELWDQRIASEAYENNWLLGFRRITNATNERTSIFTIIPRCTAGNQEPVVRTNQPPVLVAALLANLNSFSFDFAARRKVTATDLNHFIVYQLPAIVPHTYTVALLNFIVPRVLELSYTAWDLQPFAQDVGYDGAPFVWDEERRFLMRCELDALYFHLYAVSRDDADYIMETFPIVKRKDDVSYGTYRTKDTILSMYDQLAALQVMRVPAPKDESATYTVPDVSGWTTWLNPPPADPRVAHPAS